VRGDAITKLPEDERDGWRALWKDVAEVLAKASKAAGAKKSPEKKQ